MNNPSLSSSLELEFGGRWYKAKTHKINSNDIVPNSTYWSGFCHKQEKKYP